MVKADLELLRIAKGFFEATEKKVEAVADQYADQFRDRVIVPFCTRHNLEFLSGNGQWFWIPKNGNLHLDVEDASIRWSHRGCAEGDIHEWALACDRDELPEFFQVWWEIEDQLMQDFMGGVLGYWIGSFNPRGD